MPTPIFVIGSNRSGTTWLANILCRHDDIIGVQAERHFGIKESAFFWKLYGRYGPLDVEENYQKLVNTYLKTDYFKITELGEQVLLQEPRPKTYQEFFRKIMDIYAEKNSCKYWLEKTPAHSSCIHELAEFYPDAIFVAIQRDVVGKVKSRIRLMQRDKELKNKKIRMIKEVFTSRMSQVHINELSKLNNRSLILQFEELKDDTKNTIKRIFTFLNLEYTPALLKNRYSPNTSFTKEKERVEVLSEREISFCKKLFRLSSFIPPIIFRAAGRMFISRSRHIEPLVLWWAEK